LSYSALLFSFIQISISIWSNFICMVHTSMWEVHSHGSILPHNVNNFQFIQMLKYHLCHHFYWIYHPMWVTTTIFY
jgi:hypothetical protein